MTDTTQLTDDERIVLEVANNPKYRSAKGRILWSLAFAEHEGYREHFPHKDKAKTTLNKLQERGIYTPPTAELTEEEKMVLELAQKYKKSNGIIDWKSAYEANPEARVRLSYGAKDPKGQKGMNIATSLRKRGLLPENALSKSMKGKKPARAEKSSRVQTSRNHPAENHVKNDMDIEAIVQQRIEAIIQDNRLCPRCGRNLEQMLRMSLMEQKFQHLPVDGSDLVYWQGIDGCRN